MMDKIPVLISGSRGFVGSFLIHHLPSEVSLYSVSHLNLDQEKDRIPPCRLAIHLAALSHKKNPTYEDFYEANVRYSEKFLQLCKEKGVQHILYLSSIKAVGEGQDNPYTELTPPRPEDSYGKTKLIAEEKIGEFCIKNSMTYTILRPPLIYGPHPKGNIASWIFWIQKGYPFPLPRKKNLRSFVSLQNLTSLIQRIVSIYLQIKKEKKNSLPNREAVLNQIYLLQDPSPIAVEDFYKELCFHLQRPPQILRIPDFLSQVFLHIPIVKNSWRKIASCLIVDDSKTRANLQWNPEVSTREGIRAMVESLG